MPRVLAGDGGAGDVPAVRPPHHLRRVRAARQEVPRVQGGDQGKGNYYLDNLDSFRGINLVHVDLNSSSYVVIM